jgi:beta-phosphoglucomutase family hydrolase
MDVVAALQVPDAIDGLLFDLDGVLTDTAKVHQAAWAEVFDAFLEARGDPEPFSADDYTAYVDGRLRQDGVRTFLASRHITLPEGSPDDAPTEETVHGIGNRKNERLLELLDRDGVERYEGSVAFLDAARDAGYRLAVVSASRNCAAALEAARLDGRFDVRVDGNVAAERSLAGKPAPDTFLAAAEELGLEPARAAVIEDAVSGVEAGRAGRFGWVVGVDRVGPDHADQLRAHGADRVVRDLSELL